MILSIQVVMVLIFTSSMVAIFSHKFDDGIVGKIALSCIALCSYFSFVNLTHGLISDDLNITIAIAAFSLCIRHYWMWIFNHFRPRLMIMIKHEKAKIITRGHK